MESTEIISVLADHGLIDADSAVVEPLTGGVSSNISLVSDGKRRLVIKQALPQLRVTAQWTVDPVRNRYEQAYINLVATLEPTAVPHILYSDVERSFFAMEFLGPPLENWKTKLLSHPADEHTASRTGEILGKIHAASWDREDIKSAFDNTPLFHELRSAPYFLHAAASHPGVAARIREQTARLEANRRCMVHGDYSPKNLLVSPERVVLIDCEVAWFGDPAFDVGFLLNHLFLKAMHRPDRASGYLDLASAFWCEYKVRMGESRAAGIESSLGWLLPMLMLARVDGKSPVEYLSAEKQEHVRHFAIERLVESPLPLGALRDTWQMELQKIPL